MNRVTYNQACSATYMCISGLNLVCNGANCVCVSGYYWNGTICGNNFSPCFNSFQKHSLVRFHIVEQKPYASSCSATEECKVALNLYCSTTGYQCECPTSLPAGRCDCASTQYYKDATSGCGQ